MNFFHFEEFVEEWNIKLELDSNVSSISLFEFVRASKV